MNKQRFIPYLIGFLFVMAAFQSCYEDKGNYDYTPVNEVEIAKLEDQVLMLGSTLTLRPQITFSLNSDPESYDYTWMLLTSTHATDSTRFIPFYEGRDIVDMPINMIPGTYNYFLRVVDKSTEVVWDSNVFKLDVVAVIDRGFMILSEVDGNSALSFINYASIDKKLTLNHLSMDAYPDLGRPITIACKADKHAPYLNAPSNLGYAVCIVGDKDVIRISHTDFSYEERFNLYELISGERPAGFSIVDLRYAKEASNYGAYVIRDNSGDLFYHSSQSGIYMRYTAPLNYTIDGVRFRPSPHYAVFGAMYGLGVIVYDDDKKSFLRKDDFEFYSKPYGDSPDGLFKFNNTGRELLSMHSRQREGNDGYVWGITAIMKDSDGKIYADKFNASTGLQIFEVEMTGAAEINNALGFEMTAQNINNEFIFYYTTNKIYVFSTSDLTSDVIYTADPGRQISMIKCNRTWNNGTQPWPDNLMVGTYDPSNPNNSGRFEVFDVAGATGALSITVNEDDGDAPLSWDGFGKIVDVDFKAR